MTRRENHTPHRPRASRALRAVGATSTGLVAVGAVAAATVLVGPWATALDGTVDTTRTVQNVTVDPAPSSLVCAPPARLPDGLAVGDSQFDATPVETTSSVVAGVLGVARESASWAALGGDPAPLTAGAEASVGVADAGSGTVVEAVPAAGEPLRAAGATTSITTAGDLRGLASASCTTPAVSHWLVGSGTEVGTTSVLTIQNPSARTATIALDVYGPTGQVALGSRGTFLVGPGQTVETRIEAVAPEQRRIAVHVQSTGARVTATLQTQSLGGLLARGVDLLTPGSEPATSVAIAGLVSDGQDLEDPTAPVVRLLVPGDESGTARVSVFGADGVEPLRGADAIELEPGTVTDVPLGGLPAGGYTVVVDADVPVVAAGGYSRSATAPEDAVVQGTLVDVAWVAGRALAEWGAAGQVAVPGGVEAVLSVGAVPQQRDGSTPDEPATSAVVHVIGADGSSLGERDLELKPGQVERIAVADLVGEGTPALLAVDAEPGATVVWGLELSADDGTVSNALVSTLVPTPADGGDGTVPVRVVDAQD